MLLRILPSRNKLSSESNVNIMKFNRVINWLYVYVKLDPISTWSIAPNFSGKFISGPGKDICHDSDYIYSDCSFRELQLCNPLLFLNCWKGSTFCWQLLFAQRFIFLIFLLHFFVSLIHRWITVNWDFLVRVFLIFEMGSQTHTLIRICFWFDFRLV